MDPNFAMAHYNIATSYAMEGRYAEAVPAFLRAIELAGRLPFMIALLAGAYARSGRTSDARAILDELLVTARAGSGVEVWIAYVLEALGDGSSALDWLERGYDAHAPFMNVIDTMFAPFESLRDHPRFLAVLERMGLGRGVPH
jgi:Flp pilus assembly protein TadD